jgi:hypothetical protein
MEGYRRFERIHLKAEADGHSEGEGTIRISAHGERPRPGSVRRAVCCDREFGSINLQASRSIVPRGRE